MSDAVSGKAIVKALNGKADVHEAVGNISAAGELRAWAARIERGDFSITSPAEGEWKAISEVVQRENAQLHDEVRRLRAALEQLIEDYERRLRSAITVIDDPNTSNEQRIRVYGKKEAYRTFIHELQALSATSEPTGPSISSTRSMTEPTGAERVRELLRNPMAAGAYRVGVIDTLNALGIKIPGINAPEKEDNA